MLSTHEFKHSSNSHPENDPACHKCDVLVIGGGAAGSAAAIRAKELGADVVLADKSVFGSSGCAALASGDLRVYFPEDDIEPHLRGRGDLANYAAARRQLEASYNVFLELERWGVPFVREKGKLWREESPSGGFDVALLGGGPAMMKAVRRKALESGVRVVNRVMIVDLLTSDGKLPTGGCAVGAIGFDTRTAKIHVFQSRSIIVCAGGFGFPYPKIGTPLTSMPIDVSGDGLAMEIRVGAVMGNLSIGAKHFHSMEFFTAPGLEHFTVQGARWVNRLGEDFTKKYEEAERLFTKRHTLNAAIDIETREGRGPVYLDCTHFTSDQIRFLWDVIPIIMANYERAGYDISRDRIPYWQSMATSHGKTASAGAYIDEKCRTTIQGLFAAGTSSDCMNVKPHVALGECFTLGWWAGESAVEYSRKGALVETVPEQIHRTSTCILEPLSYNNGLHYDSVHEKFARTLIDLGSILNTSKLDRAIKQVKELQKESSLVEASDPHELVKVWSLRNALFVEELVLLNLLHRQESRGSVLNSDYPDTDNENWLTWTRCKLLSNQEFYIYDEHVPAEAFGKRKPSMGKKLHPMFKVLKTYGKIDS